MDPFIVELLKQGGLFAVGGTFAYLFFNERKEHKATRDKLEVSWKDRVADSKENTDKVTVPLESISQGIKNLGDKIEIGRKQ